VTHKWTHCYQLKPGRWVFAPTAEAKKTGARIKREVAARWKPPSFYFHLRAGGHIAAVRFHASNKFFYCADLDDFFGRVSRSRVTRCLKPWFCYADAREMASESVVKRPGPHGFVLPYGFVQSPILASLALDKSKLGSYLRKLNGRSDLKVSVYVDDIIISGDDKHAVGEAADQLEQAAEAALLPTNATKKEGPAIGITAFNIEVSHQMLRITEARLVKLRGAYQAATSAYCKAGILSYVESVNTDQGNEFK
jgi:hypothetical protein